MRITWSFSDWSVHLFDDRISVYCSGRIKGRGNWASCCPHYYCCIIFCFERRWRKERELRGPRWHLMGWGNMRKWSGQRRILSVLPLSVIFNTISFLSFCERNTVQTNWPLTTAWITSRRALDGSNILQRGKKITGENKGSVIGAKFFQKRIGSVKAS